MYNMTRFRNTDRTYRYEGVIFTKATIQERIPQLLLKERE
jgi:hypothetical protein